MTLTLVAIATGTAMFFVNTLQSRELAKLNPSPMVKSPAQRRAMREDCRRKGL